MGIIIRQSIKGTIANYIGILVGFITTFFVLTSYLSQEEIGLTKVLVDAALLFSGIAQLGTNSSMIKFFPYFKDDNKNDHGIFFWSIIVPIIGFIIFITIFLLCKEQIIGLFAEKSPLFTEYFYFIIPLAFFMLYMSVFEVNSTVLMRITVPKIIREVGIRILLLISYILFGFDIISLEGLVICFCITYAIGTLLNVIYLLTLKRVSFKPDMKHITKPLKREFFLYTAFIVSCSLVTTITPVLNTFFISAKMGLIYTGIFTIANYIATVIETPYRSLGTISLPHISAAIKENNLNDANTLCQKVSLHQLLAGTFIFLLIWINIDFLFQLLPNGEEYIKGKWVVFILAMSRLLYSSFNISISALNFSKYYYYSFFLFLILTVSAIFFNVKFIPLFGINGAALATLTAYFIYYVLALTIIKIKTKISLFSHNQLKIIVIAIIGFGINALWNNYASSWFETLPYSPFINSSIECLIKTGIIGIGGFAAVYYWNVSQEVNGIIKKVLKLKK